MRLHVLLRSPAPEEAARVHAAGPELQVRATPPGATPPPAAPADAAPPVEALLLSGDATPWLAALRRLAAAEPPGPALADLLSRALFPERPRTWRLRTRELALDRPLVMGVVNVTPDSFSDGGRFDDAGAGAAHGRALAEAGADLLDVGGESTRPGAARVAADEELHRVLPVVAALAAEGRVVSVDTSRAEVARAAIAAGAEVVNDVGAFGLDPAMAAAVAETGAGAVLMHMRGTPATMQERPWYQDPAGEVLEFLGAALERARAAGVAPERCAVDPGIGFGKRLADNEELIRRLPELAGLGRPLLVGPSRKGFLDPAKRNAPAERLPETIAAACLAAVGGAHILRVHDVRECRRALEVVCRIEAWCGGELSPGPTI